METTIIYAPSINGGEELLPFELNEETGMFHWNGLSNYAGYSEEELLARDGAYRGN